MSTQQIFAQELQTPFGFAEDAQPPIAFPLSLVERYQPRQLGDLIGLEGPRRVLDALIKAPRPCSMLFVGKPGVGKTIAGLCFADTLGASLVHVSSQKCDVATLDALRNRFAYHPPTGNFWICLVDEADQMSEKAQIQLLSRLDATASLTIGFGGASTRKSQPPIIWIFTANGLGEKGTNPPPSLEKRFLSRCMVIPFEPMPEAALSAYLCSVWGKEAPDVYASRAYFDFLACGGEIRESMMKMQTDLLAGSPRPIPTVELAKEKDAVTYAKIDRNIKAAGRYIPQWKRVYGGRGGEQLNRILRLLASHGIETLARDDRSNARAREQKLQCVLVRRNSYPEAMSLVAQKA